LARSPGIPAQFVAFCKATIFHAVFAKEHIVDPSSLDISTIVDKGLTVINALGALVTAGATIMLVRVTRILTLETARLRKQGKAPELIIYLDVDFEAEDQPVSVVLSNVGAAAAYNLKIEYDPDQHVKVLQDETVAKDPWSFRFSNLFFNKLPIVPPGKSYFSQFSVVNDGTGHIKKFVEIETTATLSYQNREGENFKEVIKVTSDNIKYTRVKTSRR
jgi:hypothetical protein